MPYRRLPNTDKARIKALKNASIKGQEILPFKLAFSQSVFQKVQSFLPTFEYTMLQHNQAYTIQVNKNKEYLKVLKKVKLYISHFIQVVNMAILRGDLSPSVRKYYGIDENDKNLPLLNTESDIIKWGEKIIKGETLRSLKGFSPITNPTIAVVKVRYEKFLEIYNYQKILQKNSSRSLKGLALLRPQADEIILNVWNEVENSFKNLPEDLKREKAKNYGLVYVFRKNEIRKINFLKPTAHELVK